MTAARTGFLGRLRARWMRRHWTPERQLEHLRQIVLADHRWLCHDPVAAELTERYLNALAADWYSRPTEDVSHLRIRIGLADSAGMVKPLERAR